MLRSHHHARHHQVLLVMLLLGMLLLMLLQVMRGVVVLLVGQVDRLQGPRTGARVASGRGACESGGRRGGGCGSGSQVIAGSGSGARAATVAAVVESAKIGGMTTIHESTVI